MVSPLFYYQLALLALVWLFIMLHLTWPKRSAATTTAPATPIQPKRTHSNEPKPFAGLTTKPPCALCEREATHPQPPPPVPPELMPPTHRRPRTVDTSQHFCPHTGCRYRGWLGLGNLRANGHPSGGRWRQLQCTSCEGYFLETHGTIFHGKQVAVELIVHVLACLAEGLGIRATARVFEVDANTVLQWLVEAAEQLRAFSRYCLCDVLVEQLQLDELYAVLRDLKAGAISEDEAIERLERSPYWVWTAMDPQSKLLLVIEVGTRTLEMAQRVVHQVVQRLAPGCVPLYLTDGLKHYGGSILDALWPVDATGAAPREGSAAQTMLGTRTRAALRSGSEVIPATTYCGRQLPGSLWDDGAGAAGAGGMRPQDQYGLCGETQPGHPSARGRGRPSSPYAVPGR